MRQSLAVRLGGIHSPASLLVRIAEVFDDGGVVTDQLDRSLQMFYRLGVVAALIVDPAQAIDIEAVIGLDL